MEHGAGVPSVDREALVEELERCLPAMSMTIQIINPDYGSWEIAVRVFEGRGV